MSDSGKKRSSSFRFFFPLLFSSSKKEKSGKSSRKEFLNVSSGSYSSNQYERPKSVTTKTFVEGTNELIYENLTVIHGLNNKKVPTDSNGSYNSSTSTLVSEIVRNDANTDEKNNDFSYIQHAAIPQVPPRPNHDIQICDNNIRKNAFRSQYPEVYYHSLEKLTDNLKVLDQIQKYKTTPSQISLESVGAEIKKVSTPFLISPKMEAEVRKIQPTRAKSLTSNKNKTTNVITTTIDNSEGQQKDHSLKTYNYSGPTSPMPINHKIPIMPKTISPYKHVRKTMNENEEKRNSLNRSNLYNITTSPKPFDEIKPSSLKITHRIGSDLENTLLREKTREKVEAFYWKKLKELKQKEDEYLLEQSVSNSDMRTDLFVTSSNCSSPLQFYNRTSSLPQGRGVPTSSNQAEFISPFTRGVVERRTDTFLYNKNRNQRVVRRYPQHMHSKPPPTPSTATPEKKTIMKRDTKPESQQPKRVSFEEQILKNCNVNNSYPNFINLVDTNFEQINPKSEMMSTLKVGIGSKRCSRPPLPPLRTTSVVGGQIPKFVNNKKPINLPLSSSACSESGSGSEADEIQRIFQSNTRKEEDWRDGSKGDGGVSDGESGRGPTRGRSSRRDDPRRHTLAGNHLFIHPQHPMQINSLDIEPPSTRGYPGSSTMLFDDDPGIMSEVETASTGFRRGNKQRSSLPVVRTPSKTLERPLGLVFLQYRNETKRALLPNEITSIDTVKALFVRSFPKQLTMQYMDSPLVKIYIHDSSKDMFYELEDVRAHLRDIRDRSVLRLFESTDIGGGAFPGAVGVGSLTMPAGAAGCSGPSSWDNDPSYFSEPEIDSDYHHQHVHKSKGKAPAYYMGTPAPSTLPRGGSMLRAFSPAATPPVPADRVKSLSGTSAPSKPIRSYIPGSGSERCFPFSAPDVPRGADQLYTIPGHSSEGYMSSPERGGARTAYEDPYYTQYLGPSAARPNITPVIDEEGSDGVVMEDAYQMYSVNPISTGPRPMPRPTYEQRIPPVDDMQRLRVEKMERQLANLTGLVQKALQVPAASGPTASLRQEPIYQGRPASQDGSRFTGTERPPKLGRDKFQKSVSFEKSVSFSDDPPDMNSPKQHSPQHAADTKPTKPAIKSSTLPRTSSQERDRLKPAPPPKPAGLVGQQLLLSRTYTINVTPEFFNELRLLQKQSRDLRIETRNLRRSTLSHAIQMRQMMADTIVKIGALSATYSEQDQDCLSREEEVYRQDMLLLENDLYELEATVERLRGQAANRETRVNMADIERIAMVLSKSSKTVADWKIKFPVLQDTMKMKLASEMEKIVRKEKMLEEEPERLELALRRCKKLTGTLVTLKRLACVQEQRLPIADGRVSPTLSQSSTFTAGPSSEEFGSDSICQVTQANKGGRGGAGRGAELRPENALDALLDELQTFSKPAPEPVPAAEPPLRRLHSYPSGSDTDASPPVRARGQHPPKPPVPERHPELLALAARRAPPPPPPRTTSRSPLASPTSPASPHSDNDDKAAARQLLLEQRHQELLKKQKALQEQYARLQMIQRSGQTLPQNAQLDLKKTGSESNLLSKLNLNLVPAALSGSMSQLAPDAVRHDASPDCNGTNKLSEVATINKVYETDIL